VSGSKPEYHLNHEESHQGDNGKQGRNKEQIHHDSAYNLLSIGDTKSGLWQNTQQNSMEHSAIQKHPALQSQCLMP
jgi:hypothetical protein